MPIPANTGITIRTTTIIGWGRMALLIDYNSHTETIRLRNDGDIVANH